MASIDDSVQCTVRASLVGAAGGGKGTFETDVDLTVMDADDAWEALVAMAEEAAEEEADDEDEDDVEVELDPASFAIVGCDAFADDLVGGGKRAYQAAHDNLNDLDDNISTGVFEQWLEDTAGNITQEGKAKAANAAFQGAVESKEDWMMEQFAPDGLNTAIAGHVDWDEAFEEASSDYTVVEYRGQVFLFNT